MSMESLGDGRIEQRDLLRRATRVLVVDSDDGNLIDDVFLRSPRHSDPSRRNRPKRLESCDPILAGLGGRVP